MAVFTWPTTSTAALDYEPRLLGSEMGDGYSQDIPDGLNYIMQAWSVTLTSLSVETCNAIEAFLKTQGGHTAFDWTPPRESATRKFKCKKWRVSPEGSYLWAIQADFKEVPA